jgi:hypothetical protein
MDQPTALLFRAFSIAELRHTASRTSFSLKLKSIVWV